MITRIKKVHYCEFCGKKYFRIDSAENHEKHCTMNPNRQCGMCDIAGTGGEDVEAMLVVLKMKMKMLDMELQHEEYEHYTSNNGVRTLDKKIAVDVEMYKAIQDITEDCPACMLAVMRQGQRNYKIDMPWNLFDYEKLVAGFWRDVNDQESLRGGYVPGAEIPF